MKYLRLYCLFVNSESNLPDMPIRWIVLHPDDPNHALIATEIGIWQTRTLLSNEIIWFQNLFKSK